MIKPINTTQAKPENVVINPCILPFVCDGESCVGGGCHGICWLD